MHNNAVKILFLTLMFAFAGYSSFAQRSNTDELLASQYLRNGEYEKAVVLYEELFKKNPDSPIFYNSLLECYIEMDELKSARDIVKSQIKRYPKHLRFEVDLGWIMEMEGDKRKARRHFNSLISDLTSNPNHIKSLADAFEVRDYLDHALEAYLEGRKKLGDDVPFNRDIANIYEKKNDYEAMMEEYVDMLELGPSYMEQAQGLMQDAVAEDPDYSKNNALRKVLLQRTQRYPSNYIYSEMLLWLSLQQKDFRLAFNQARALDRRLQRGGEIVLRVAGLSLSNKDYDIALDAYQYIINLGKEYQYYLQAQIGKMDAHFQKVISQYDFKKEDLYDVEKEYENVLDDLSLNSQTVRLLRNLANMKAFYLDKTDEAVDLLRKAIALPSLSRRVKAECQIELADILLLKGDIWDANLLYAEVDRMFRDDPLAHEARFKNARLSYFIGEFDWAKAQLDVLKAATSKFIANDAMKLSLRIQDNIGFDEDTKPLERFSRAEKHLFMNKLDEAETVLDSIVNDFPTHQILDDAFFMMAEIKITQGKHNVADSLLAFVAEHFPDGLLADEALFKRADIQEKVFNNDDKALELYQKLMTGYPGSVYTVVARNHFRRLREKMVN